MLLPPRFYSFLVCFHFYLFHNTIKKVQCICRFVKINELGKKGVKIVFQIAKLINLRLPLRVPRTPMASMKRKQISGSFSSSFLKEERQLLTFSLSKTMTPIFHLMHAAAERHGLLEKGPNLVHETIIFLDTEPTNIDKKNEIVNLNKMGRLHSFALPTSLCNFL